MIAQTRLETNGSVRAPPVRRIWLCADDYGISPSVDRAIRDLVERGRLNATSVMVAAPSFDQLEAESLQTIRDGGARVAFGLHVTLTAPFKPISQGFWPLRGGSFLPLEPLLVCGTVRLLRRKALEIEIATQFKAFVSAFGRAPDFIDGHQHVHLFPQVRDALLTVMLEVAPNAWVRQCGSAIPVRRRYGDRKALLLDMLSRKFRELAAEFGIATNPAFAGAYDFAAGTAPDFAALFPAFLHQLPTGSVVMCHPGFVDPELERLDPLTDQREREYDYLAGEAFPRVLADLNVTLA